MLIMLKLLNGEEIEQSIDSNVCVIGRSSKCNLVVPHEGMSRMHCQIEFMNGDYFVTDLGSTNGVLIDGKKIEPHKKVRYQTYLNLSFGAVQSLQIKEDSTMAAIRVAPAPVPEEGKEKVSSLTKTRPMKESTKSTIKPPPPKKEDNSQEKVRTLAVIILIFLIIGGAIYWYLPKDQSGETEMTPEEIYN